MKTHILCSITFFRKTPRLWDNVEKCGGASVHKWRHNMAHTRCMLDKQGYMHTRACTRPRVRVSIHACTHWQICNTYCFSTATVIRERALVLRYTFIACLVFLRFGSCGTRNRMLATVMNKFSSSCSFSLKCHVMYILTYLVWSPERCVSVLVEFVRWCQLSVDSA
jgi:hypothetical protein